MELRIRRASLREVLVEEGESTWVLFSKVACLRGRNLAIHESDDSTFAVTSDKAVWDLLESVDIWVSAAINASLITASHVDSLSVKEIVVLVGKLEFLRVVVLNCLIY